MPAIASGGTYNRKALYCPRLRELAYPTAIRSAEPMLIQAKIRMEP